ncbi:hypothetical protein NQ318_019834 [Aromia moschata]|uniref:PHD finger protein 20 n=1 Tax=Aromia moschata TaxID=1265417 RepID=A0AAV8YLS5_9CUCU|nr:hypothetical protein NQ318_019834 [Aromia moschata]
MGRKCSVKGCLSDSNRPEDMGVTFHKVPMHSDVRPKWMSLCRISDDKKLVKIIYVCSRHFLRADFCNFKGKKYMLKQGVLPSVFPWDKSKLEAIKAEASIKKESSSEEVASSPVKREDEEEIKQEIKEEPEQDIKVELTETDSRLQDEIKVEPKEKLDEFEKSKLAQSTSGFMNFAINSRIEALDFNNDWYPARIVEVDYEENEVLIHFEKFSSKYDEWICMNSSRLRPLQAFTKKGIPIERFTVGGGAWPRGATAGSSGHRHQDHGTRHSLTVDGIQFEFHSDLVIFSFRPDTYEVLFDDGFVKTLKAHRMSKTEGKVHSAPLFDPIKSSKQDRRDKKRKLNVAALFKKKPRAENAEEKPKKAAVAPPTPESPSTSTPVAELCQNWAPLWLKGKPVGTDSTIETSDGTKNSVIVPDPRLPTGWNKHLLRRTHGANIGKWETIIVGPDGKKFRSRTDARTYIEQNPALELNENMFDFSLSGTKRHRRSGVKKAPEVAPQEVAVVQEPPEVSEPPAIDESKHFFRYLLNPNSLKILFEGDAYKCPIEGCGKNFRRENLAQMHVKHYHPEYTKFLDSTPNVADLAYARTVGENLDKSPGPPKPLAAKPAARTSTPKAAKSGCQSPLPDVVAGKPQSPSLARPKDAEIIKLLSARPREAEPSPATPPAAGPYPDIKLKDLLSKSEGVPRYEEPPPAKSLPPLRTTPGIKTLLPVVRPPQIVDAVAEEAPPRYGAKRKRGPSENADIKGNEPRQPTPPPPPATLPTPSQTPLTPETHQPPPPQQPPPQQPSQPPPLNDVIIEGGEVIKIVRMRQEEIINCTCGFTEEDGLMIQCELCLCWQHAYCNNIERESQVPEKYVCYICQHPLRERSSRRHYHDQDWLRQGSLPTGGYHSRDEDALQRRFDKLKRLHDMSGGAARAARVHAQPQRQDEDRRCSFPPVFFSLLPFFLAVVAFCWFFLLLFSLLPLFFRLSGCVVTNLSSSRAKNHPKLYLWSKPWPKTPLPEKAKEECEESKPKPDSPKPDLDLERPEPPGDSMLMMILKAGKEVMPKLDLNSLMEGNMAPIIPQPEAAIDSADCRLNLLDHIGHQEALVEQRLDEFERQIEALEEGTSTETDADYPRTRQTLQMLIRDLGTLREFSQSTTI